MIALRLKLIGLAVLGALATMGYLYTRWRIAASRAASATQRAESLDASRRLELRIAARRAELRQREQGVRAEIERRERDWFEGGWGP